MIISYTLTLGEMFLYMNKNLVIINLAIIGDSSFPAFIGGINMYYARYFSITKANIHLTDTYHLESISIQKGKYVRSHRKLPEYLEAE